MKGDFTSREKFLGCPANTEQRAHGERSPEVCLVNGEKFITKMSLNDKKAEFFRLFLYLCYTFYFRCVTSMQDTMRSEMQ